MIDVTYFGDKYFNWRPGDEEELLEILRQMKLRFTFEINDDDIIGPQPDNEYGYPGKIAPFMEDTWTYFYQHHIVYFFFKSEKDKIKAILLK